jgi:hypothetical protein
LLNIVIQSFSVYGVIMDIVNIRYKLGGMTNPINFQIVLWIFMPAARITFTFDHFSAKVMKKITREDANGDIAELAFEHLSVEKSEEKALFCLIYAVLYYLVTYLDFTFIIYIIKSHRNTGVICYSVCIVSWLPGEMRSLTVLCSEGSTRQEMDFSEK